LNRFSSSIIDTHSAEFFERVREINAGPPAIYICTPIGPGNARTPAATLILTKQPNATHEQWFNCFFGDKKNIDKWCDNTKTLASRAHNDDSKMIVVFFDVDMPAMMQCKSLNC
jgi:hypothetical protein